MAELQVPKTHDEATARGLLVLRTEWGVLVIDPNKAAITKDGHIRPHAAGIWADETLRTNIRRIRRGVREQKR